MRLKTKKYDVANYLDSGEMIAAYLDAAFESGDTSRIAEALGDVAREQLYKSLSAEGKPELSTVLKVMAAFGGGLKSDFPRSRASRAPRRAKTPAPGAKTRRVA